MIILGIDPGVATVGFGVIKTDNGKLEYLDCGVIEIYSKDVNKLPASSNFVSLCWKESSDTGVYSKCELARLMVSAEDRT